ncbi:hypothetical protein TanjilG_08965 [Lupinus angustifolius]|uniref:WAT1-related protein n=1 Tax=Lupinus angustifolius TaxID=3871 RepID=A0A4P1QP71_LUPAN|nr:hypothetical protein TanjilG_08965 [Lupinus angustifolius]
MIMMKSMRNLVHGLKPALLMVLVQIANAWVNVMYKLAVNDGMSLRVVVAYRYIFATAFIAPLAFILERKKRPKMSWTILFQAFLCGLFGGALPQNLHMEALALTSVTFTTAVSNLIPAITFILSLLFRLETLNLRAAGGRAKMIGTIIGIGGAMVLTFIKGVEIKMLSFHINLFNHKNNHVVHPQASSHAMFILGAFSSFASNISYALWLIIQGIVVSGIMVAAISWCVRTRGPLFVSVFSPLMLVVVAFAGSTILDEKLYLGSIIGSVLIVCGLYIVLWGKSKEMRKNIQSVSPNGHHDFKTVEIIVKSQVLDNANHENYNTLNNIGGKEVISRNTCLNT